LSYYGFRTVAATDPGVDEMEKYLQYEKNTFQLFEYIDKESGRETVCNLELLPHSDGKVMAWVRDYPCAPVSISTSAPSLRDAICEKFNIAPEKLILIERCFINIDRHPDAHIRHPELPFYRIEFTDDGPEWHPLDVKGCADMMLQMIIGFRERNPHPSDKGIDFSTLSPFGSGSQS
jgi:hypothetical protein